MLRSDYAEMAKAVHSACAAISTVFLSIRIWARKTQAKGLWWDDYLRMYILSHFRPPSEVYTGKYLRWKTVSRCSMDVSVVRKRSGGCFAGIRVQRPGRHISRLDTRFCVLDLLLPGNSAGQDGFQCDTSPCLEWQNYRIALVYHCGRLRFRHHDYSHKLAHSVRKTNRPRHTNHLRVGGHSDMDPRGKRHRHHLH